MKLDKPISTNLLAVGYCKSLSNAERLIDEGRVLLGTERCLGAFNSFCLAEEEIAKAILMSEAVAYAETDSVSWRNFWNAFDSHEEKQKILLRVFHGGRFPNTFNKTIREARNNSIYVGFAPATSTFWSPAELFSRVGDLKVTARNEHIYVSGLLDFFTRLAGMPTVETMEKVFKMQRDNISQK
jgi:AbiV family abortive infection protein